MYTLPTHAQRMTRQRRVLLETLRRYPTHPTADELFRMVRRELPHISLGTVYRNLDVLCRGGLARRLEGTQGPARYDGDVAPHQHVRCVQCGVLDDVPPGAFAAPALPERTPGGFRVTGARLELIGVCPLCQNETRAALAGAGRG